MSYRLSGACVTIEYLVMGALENNVYIIDDGKGCLVVDPAMKADLILEALDGRKLDAIVVTHAHWDHVGAAADLREATGATVVASAADGPAVEGRASLGSGHRRFAPCRVDRMVDDGDTLEVGGMQWKVMATPGHTPGSMCLFLDPRYGSDRAGTPVLIAGDTLFCGTHGRTDFEGGDPSAMSTSLRKLAELPGETLVLPGHNSTTTIARERDWLRRGGLYR